MTIDVRKYTQRIASVVKQIKQLRPNELIIVYWWDAVSWRDQPKVSRAPTNFDPLVATMGLYEGVIQGRAVDYLAVNVEDFETRRDVTYIPIPLIHEITKEVKKRPKRLVRKYAHLSFEWAERVLGDEED